MAAYKSFAAAAAPFGKAAKSLSKDGLNEVEKAVDAAAQDIAVRAASADLGGDASFSGWRRNKPIPLAVHTEKWKGGAGVIILPTRQTAGLWTVAESGRKAYARGERRQSGTRTRKKDGVVVAKYRKVGRNLGATSGKSTASDAVGMFRSTIPTVISREITKSISKYLGG